MIETKNYLREQWRIACRDYSLYTGERKEEALKDMRRIKEVSAVIYGFAFADSLKMDD